VTDPPFRRYIAGNFKNSDERLRRASYSQVRERIARARRMNVHELSMEQVAFRIGLIMDGYRTMIRPLELNGAFRARKNVGSKLFEHVSELWYPPASAITSRGRFNQPHEPLLYVCNTAHGAAFEIRPAINDLITIAVLKTKRPPFITLQCAHIGLDRSESPAFGPEQKKHIPRSHPGFQTKLRDDGLTKKWMAVDSFLSDIATATHGPADEQDQYKITNAVSRVLLTISGVHGLTYPSVATQLKNLNVAIKPEVADKELEISEAWLMSTDARAEQLPRLDEAGPFYRTRFLRRSLAIEPNGRIQWSAELQDVQPHDIVHLAHAPRKR
jgi:hypothetical protein